MPDIKTCRIMKHIILTFIILCVLGFYNTQGQVPEVILPAGNNLEHQKMFQQRAKDCVGQLVDYISAMTAKQINGHPTLDDIYQYRKSALDLFLYNGDSILLSNGVKIAPVIIETARVRSQGVEIKYIRPVKIYFTRIIDLIKRKTYTDVTLKSAEIVGIDVSNIQKVGDMFQCVVFLSQNFIERRGELKTYCKANMTITVYFTKICCEEFILKIGDISIVETVRL